MKVANKLKNLSLDITEIVLYDEAGEREKSFEGWFIYS